MAEEMEATGLSAVHLHRTVAPTARVAERCDVAGDQSPFIDLRGSAPDTPHFAALSWTDADADPLGDATWLVERTVVWDDDPGDVDPAGWIKQVSLVRRHVDIDPVTFAWRYAGHRSVARRHHGMFRYAQSIVVEARHGVSDDADRIDGISELWFRDRTHWRDGFYTTDEGPDAVRSDTERFIDFATTKSAIVLEWPAMGELP